MHSGVSVFSYTAVKGYKAEGKKHLQTIGLLQIFTEGNSLMFMAFVEDEKMDEVYGKVKISTPNKVSNPNFIIVTLNIEKSI